MKQPPFNVDMMRQLIVRHKTVPLFTDKLFSWMSYQWQEMSPLGERQDFLDSVMEQYKLVQEMVDEILEIKPANKRARILYELVDMEIAMSHEKDMAASGKTIQCRRGCSSCCHLNVDISDDEASIMRFHWKGEHRDRLRKQAKVNVEDFPYVLGYEDSACIFLKDGACSIYEDRPVACRTHFSVSDPELCDPVKHPRGMVQLTISQKIEMLKTVMYAKMGCTSMARQLLKK